MRLGYAWHGFLADKKIKDGKEVSTPDGNAFYSWSIIDRLLRHKVTVLKMMPDRDSEAVTVHGADAFGLFAKEARYRAWHSSIPSAPGAPIDALLLEWRFPIPGRNTEVDKSDPAYQPDLDIQEQLLLEYGGRIPIAVLDLDYKLTEKDEARLAKMGKVFVLDPGHKPPVWLSRIHVEIPFAFEYIDKFSVRETPAGVVYVGNRYERDDAIDRYLSPLPDMGVGVTLHGNWLEGGRDSAIRWPQFNFKPRVSMSQFREAHAAGNVVPLMAKPEYMTHGFMTARIIEAVFFGAVPVGFYGFKGIERYLPIELLVDSPAGLAACATVFSGMRAKEAAVRLVRSRLSSFMDASFFVRRLLHGVTAAGAEL